MNEDDFVMKFVYFCRTSEVEKLKNWLNLLAALLFEKTSVIYFILLKIVENQLFLLFPSNFVYLHCISTFI